jgi:putative membrane protein
MMHGSGMMNGMPVMSPLMWIFVLLLWGFALFGVICAIRMLIHRKKPQNERPEGSNALDILEKRYAKGELSREDFERMKKDLKRD